ncbi:histone-lysine N-methyltransferase SETD1B-like [Papaver somniferum]|uniref:histone-lysine N-methyltransferase SETD1B-like n=1 Tax=Papaver somniferum TaxID=3469 RepID=UPI000E6F7F1A|nr:histone-lysine N-methyltransferase SETD1B-like [Papaver somniferum]
MSNQEHNQGNEEEIVEAPPAEEEEANEDDNDDGEGDDEDGDKDGDNEDESGEEEEDSGEEEEEEEQAKGVKKKPRKTLKNPCARYAYIPDDNLCLPPKNPTYGLPVTGTSVRDVYDPSMSYELLEKLVEKCLGWNDVKAQCEVKRAAKEPEEGDEYS